MRENKDKLRKQMEEFEEGYADGIYAIPRDRQQPKVKVRALHDSV